MGWQVAQKSTKRNTKDNKYTSTSAQFTRLLVKVAEKQKTIPKTTYKLQLPTISLKKMPTRGSAFLIIAI